CLLPALPPTAMSTLSLHDALPIWRVRDINNAAPGVDRFIVQVSLFMTLVGLTALLVAGVGIANAVRAFLEEKRNTIATLKCLGADRKSTRLNSSHVKISYAVFCLK